MLAAFRAALTVPSPYSREFQEKSRAGAAARVRPVRLRLLHAEYSKSPKEAATKTPLDTDLSWIIFRFMFYDPTNRTGPSDADKTSAIPATGTK